MLLLAERCYFHTFNENNLYYFWRSGESNKIQLCPVCCSGEGNLWFSFKFKILHSCNEVLVAHSKVTNSPSFSCSPLGAIWPTQRTTVLKNPIYSSLGTGGTYVSLHTKFYHFLTDFSETLNMYNKRVFYP